MRIAQVAPLYESVPPQLYGGTERVVSWLTEELVSRGHEVTLFASGDSLTSARLVPVCPKALRLDANCVDYLAQHIVELGRLFRDKDEFDIVHFHIDYIHFPPSRESQLLHLTTLHGRLDLPDLVPVYREFADAPVVSISDSQRAPLPWLNWQGTVHHGLPVGTFAAHTRPGKYLAFLGRVSPEKGVDEAIEIAKKSGIPMKIAAKIDHVDRDYFERQIKPMLDSELVEFIGEISDFEKSEFLGNALALVFPINWQEPFGIVLIEALACGLPVVAYPLGSVPEIIDDGVTGFLVNDVSGAVRALDRIEEIDRQTCRRVFEERFSSARMARDYQKIYERIVKNKREKAAFVEGDLKWMKRESPSNTT